MSEFHFVVVSWNTHGKERDSENFINTLNKANDWIEFQDKVWLVWTKQTSKTWYERLKPHIGERDNLFVIAADVTDRGGWMPRAFWEFVKRKTPLEE
mgnify:CR=1 FL=1